MSTVKYNEIMDNQASKCSFICGLGLKYFIVMNEGKTAADYLRENHNETILQILRMLQDVADTLTTLHSQGLVHNDLRPENVLYFATEKKAGLIDFDKSQRMNAVRSLFDEPPVLDHFAKPRKQPFSLTTDIYQLGILFLALLLLPEWMDFTHPEQAKSGIDSDLQRKVWVPEMLGESETVSETFIKNLEKLKKA